MRDKPLLYIDLDFMEAFIAKARKNHLDLSTIEANNIIHIKYLLENYALEFELDSDKLRKIIALPLEDIANFEKLAIELSIDIYLLKYIRKLYQKNTEIKSVKDKLYNLKQLNTETAILPNCIMINCDDTIVSNFENHYCFACYNTSFTLNEKYLTTNPISIDKDLRVLEVLENENLKPVSSVIFSDPYIFANDAKGNDLIELLKIIFKNRIEKENNCLIEYCDDKDKFKETEFEKTFRTIFTKTILRFSKRSSRNLHDRNIFTNNYTISADAGFKIKYDKVTKWIIYPILTNYHFQKQQTKKYLNEYKANLNY
jgi:hypothetical protein